MLGPYVVFGSTFDLVAYVPLDVELDRALGDLSCGVAVRTPHRLRVRERDVSGRLRGTTSNDTSVPKSTRPSTTR